MVPAYARVLLGKKPYIAPPGTVIEPVELEVRRVVLSAAHLQRYRDVCAVPARRGVAAGLSASSSRCRCTCSCSSCRNFPVKVLGLIHLRNTIRVLHPVEQRAPLRLTVHFDTMRLTDFGQEYDFTTRYEQNGVVVWEEVSTMFARGNTAPKEGSKRPAIERSNASGERRVDRDARSRRQHRLALRARVRRFQSDSSHGAHGARCSASSRQSRTACGRSGRCLGCGGAALAEGQDADRHAVQAAGLHSFAGAVAHLDSSDTASISRCARCAAIGCTWRCR